MVKRLGEKTELSTIERGSTYRKSLDNSFLLQVHLKQQILTETHRVARMNGRNYAGSSKKTTHFYYVAEPGQYRCERISQPIRRFADDHPV